MNHSDSKRPGAPQGERGDSDRAAGGGSRSDAMRSRDDVSSAPESGDKPQADARDPLRAADAGRPPFPQEGSEAARAKDDVSSAPESGDKPDAAGA
ncbi:hypothetical protein [Caldimonas tepidiphila]|uniref:hypothetical protein n=1 Tax=Caldimonas tepidiphila TaxID=2315841 RepID=UPI0013002D77|nr:hypothetical protein [Caldimonas tepidiphila]